MYVKITKSKDHQYVQVVESYRDEKGVPRHKVLFNFGRLDALKKDPSFLNVIEKLKSIITDNPDFEDITPAEIVNWGYKIYEKIWKKLKIDEMLDEVKLRTRAKFDLTNSCLRMVIEHLLNPKSKLGIYNNQMKYFGLPEVELQHLYRSLDILSDHKDDLEKELFLRNMNLFNMKIDVVFYDVTTFYFESVKADSLKDFGFSKDNKFNEVQVVLGLLINLDGMPIGYELFPGNTFDGKTLENALEKLKKRFMLNKVIIVADKGINSKVNLKRIKAMGFEYIVASRIKSLPKDIQEKIFIEEGYNTVEKEEIRYKVIDYENLISEKGNKEVLKEKLIITYSPKRAEKDRYDRERLIEKAKRLLEKGSLNLKQGGRKYLKISSACTLDEESILRDERFDGYYGIQTSEENLSAHDVISAYHNLWRIEESFRIMKSHLEVRPIFHWTEKRIKGHFFICFLAFLVQRTLELNLKKSEIDITPSKIRESINNMNFAKFDSSGQTYLLKTRYDDLGTKILRTFKIPSPKTLSILKDINL